MKRRTVLIAGMIISTALFVILGRFVNIPLGIGEQRLALEFAVLGFAAAALGPLPGIGVGFIGMFVLNFLLGRLWWSEIVAAMLMGSIIGLCERSLSILDGGFEPRGLLTYAGFSTAACALCWLLICPTLDTLIYHFELGGTLLYWAFYTISVVLCTVVLGGLLCLGLGMYCQKWPLTR
ncbi:MAG: ECF transporter S component [Lachnospiraceae bacterium]|nr:ECF transporter S component [Lachnospiraceae bacterium]